MLIWSLTTYQWNKDDVDDDDEVNLADLSLLTAGVDDDAEETETRPRQDLFDLP